MVLGVKEQKSKRANETMILIFSTLGRKMLKERRTL